MEKQIWSDTKRANEIMSNQNTPLDYKYTLSQKVAFQLEEQL